MLRAFDHDQMQAIIQNRLTQRDHERTHRGLGSLGSSGPSICPYSSECVEGKFHELRTQDPA